MSKTAKTYLVKGTALMPVEVTVYVEAATRDAALTAAAKVFEKRSFDLTSQQRCRVENVGDASAAYDFEAIDAYEQIED